MDYSINVVGKTGQPRGDKFNCILLHVFILKSIKGKNIYLRNRKAVKVPKRNMR